jgi:ubiquinone/menaquinone biosynthesis C-methylase UbiE
MPTDNAAQIDEWNGSVGRRWVAFQPQLDRMIEPFGEAALRAAAARQGERLLDIGCGCGSTALALAQAVGPQGSVLGVDISRPMLAVARQRGAAAGMAWLSFIEADASDSPLPLGHDLLFSRFGVMFFAAPASALHHLRARLRPGGRCAFVCWRTPRDNPWAMLPLIAARQALGITPTPADPLAPGPFAFADDQRLHALLAEAGFADIELQRLDSAIHLGASAREAAAHSLQIGPASRLAAEAGPAHEPVLVAALEQALAPHAAADGSISLQGSTWLVSAGNPA